MFLPILNSSIVLDIAIEKCYEQLNYIRDSYAEVSIESSIE